MPRRAEELVLWYVAKTSFSIWASGALKYAIGGLASRAATFKRRGIRHLALFKTRVVTVDGAVALLRTYRTLVWSGPAERSRFSV